MFLFVSIIMLFDGLVDKKKVTLITDHTRRAARNPAAEDLFCAPKCVRLIDLNPDPPHFVLLICF